MSLIAPLGLLLGLTLPVVVVFYLLKVRRHEEEVSSTFLWQDLLRDLAAHEPLQRLRWNLLLVLQLIALGLFTLAFARPFFEQPGERPVQAVLVLDGSASMQAADVSPSRFDRAVAAARQTLQSLPEDSVATLILAADHPRILAAATGDRRQTDRALTEARPTGAAGNMLEALLLARSLGGDAATRRIYVFTDGAFTLPLDVPDDLGKVDVSLVGGSAGNVAITTVSTRPDPRDARRQQVFARVENLSDQPTQAQVALAADGEVVDERALDLAPNSASDQVFENLPPGARAASLRLQPRDADNAFRLDDSAYAVLTPRKSAEVLLVSPGNPFLEKVLGLLPGVDLYRIDARRYLAIEADRFDVVVFDAYLPPLLPRGNLLVINPPERGAIRTNGEVRRPKIAAWERDNPLLAFVDVRDLTISQASRLEPARWARPLIATEDGVPLLVAGQDGDRRLAVLPFDLRQSNLPFSAAFPILMSNLVGYLAPTGVVTAPEIRTGEAETLAPLPQVERVRVVGPGDRTTEIPAGGNRLTYAATDEPGLYHVQQVVGGGGQTVEEELFAANLADREESDVRTRLAGLASTATATPFEPFVLRREFWLVLAALAFPLLLGEWWWFQQRL